MNIEMLTVVISLIMNLMMGGNGWWGTIPTGEEIQKDPMSLVNVLYLFGGNLNIYESGWQEVDQTIDLGDGSWERYGFGSGSTVRVHGNLKNGMWLDFSIKGKEYQVDHQEITPVEGVTITTHQYDGGEKGFDFSIGPISLSTALNLLSLATQTTQ